MDGRQQNLQEPLLSKDREEAGSPPYIPRAWRNNPPNLRGNSSSEGLNTEKENDDIASSSSAYITLLENKEQLKSWFSCASSFFWCCFPVKSESKPAPENSPKNEFTFPK